MKSASGVFKEWDVGIRQHKGNDWRKLIMCPLAEVRTFRSWLHFISVNMVEILANFFEDN